MKSTIKRYTSSDKSYPYLGIHRDDVTGEDNPIIALFYLPDHGIVVSTSPTTAGFIGQQINDGTAMQESSFVRYQGEVILSQIDVR